MIHSWHNMIQIDKCGNCARFTIRNKYCTEKISISLIKIVWNIKVYIEIYYLWLGFGKSIVSIENCSSTSEIANKKSC